MLYTSSMIQQEAQEKSPVLGTLYELGTTLSNMAPSVLASALGGWALGGTGMAAGTAAMVAGLGGSAMLGASAGGNAYTQALNEGRSTDEARTYEQGAEPEKGRERAARAARVAFGRASDVLSSPMEYIDQFVAGSLVRARYNQNLGKGMSEAAAMADADAFAANVMADRSKGAVPTLFQRSNPLTKVFTQFQLEVNNQLSYIFKDIPRDMRERGVKALAGALIKFTLGAWLFDELYEWLIGRRPALDPIGILNDTVGDLTGWEAPNLVDLGLGAISGNVPSFQVEQTGVGEAGVNLAE